LYEAGGSQHGAKNSRISAGVLLSSRELLHRPNFWQNSNSGPNNPACSISMARLRYE
jgi:hypothetical protein